MTTRFFTAFAGCALLSGCVTQDDSWSQQSDEVSHHGPRVTTVATGLTNPRGLIFGPDHNLYVTQAGTGGTMTAPDTPECPANFNIYSPYTAGYSGSVLRIHPNGHKDVVVDHLPSMTDAYGGSYGPTDVAFIDNKLYVLIELGDCAHGLTNDFPAVLRVNHDGSTTNVANINAWIRANPPFWLPDTDPATTDIEPGGVTHSMIAVDGFLYVVETNRAQLLKINPRTGQISRLYDMSRDQHEHNPIVMTKHDSDFFVGTFGDDSGPAELAKFDRRFNHYTLPFAGPINPIVGLTWRNDSMYGMEIFPYTNEWTPDGGSLIKFDHSGNHTTLLPNFSSYPNGLVVGPDGALYTSNQGMTFTGDGDGSILRIAL